MPYTLAHPGFVLPLKKIKPEWFSTSGLVFGSIAPDFDIILRFTNPRMHIFQYTISEIIFFILPIAVCSAVYFHLVIKPMLLQYAPTSLKNSLSKYYALTVFKNTTNTWLKLITSSLLAIIIHLALDLVAHFNAGIFKINAMFLYQSLIIGEIVYYSTLYLPGIFLSVIGFYLIFQYLKENKISIPTLREIYENENTKQFVFTFIIVTIIFTIIKIFITGIENKFPIDSIVIHLTNGILISFFITPALFFVQHRLKTSNA